MTTAFHGDPAIRADLLARLRRHASAGTLVFGPTRWDGRSGTPLGVSAQSEDSADYSERFGYPLPLAGLLDIMAACAAPEQAVGDTLAWVETVEPGADLSPIPWRIAENLLLLLKADQLAAPHFHHLRELHRRDTDATPVPSRDWAELRGRIETGDHGRTAEAAIATGACATACWSLRTSRSMLVELIDRWRHAAGRLPNPDFDEADRSHAVAVLDALLTEKQAAHEAGEAVHIPTLFRLREPRVAALFEADLERSNRLFRERSHAVPALVLRQIATAGRGDQDFAAKRMP